MMRFTDGAKIADIEVKKDGRDITFFAVDFYDFNEADNIHLVSKKLDFIRRELEQEEGLEITWNEVKR